MTQAPDPNNQPNSKPTLSEQIADIALKVIMTGGVAGGGLGAFWSLFRESNVPKAIVSAVIGLGISYAAKLLQPIHEGNQRRLENTGKAIDKTIDNSTRYVIGKISGGTIEDRYLACQAADCPTVMIGRSCPASRDLYPVARGSVCAVRTGSRSEFARA